MGLFFVTSTLAPEYLLNLSLLQQNVLNKKYFFFLSSRPSPIVNFLDFRRWQRLLLGLWTLSSVLGTTLCAVCHTCGIKSSTNDVIANTWEVLNTTATNQHD